MSSRRKPLIIKKTPVCLFGTDGIRGLANAGPLEMKQVQRLGEATAWVLERKLKRRAKVGLGWDTRISSPALAAALTAGLAGSGAGVWRFGVMPTPAVSQLTRTYGLDAGIVISASHNPAEDNGIKYFNAEGGKFPDAAEAELERLMAQKKPLPQRRGVELGAIQECAADAAAAYVGHLAGSFRRAGLKGLKLVVDLANGATCRTVPTVFAQLGIRAEYHFQEPDGHNINRACGSLHPDAIAKRVRTTGAHAGLAFDGDGDRVILVDEQGRVVNGDRVLGILAVHEARAGRLPGRAVVATVMSNLGLELYLRSHQIKLERAPVGDRYVAQVMRRHGYTLGGEQSGHILLPRLSPTGDGLLTALAVLSVLRTQKLALSELAGGWKDFPQLLVNVRVARRPDLGSLTSVQKLLHQAERDLHGRGRVNLRYSGTELLARVMVEAESEALAENWAHRLADALEAEIGNGHRRTATWLTSA